MSGFCPFHSTGTVYNLEPHHRDEIGEKKVIEAFMHYKTSCVRGRRPQLPFLKRNLTYNKMNKRCKREEIERFIDSCNNYPAFAIEQAKNCIMKRPLKELIVFFGKREEENLYMQRISGLQRSFSIGQMADMKWCVDSNISINFNYLNPPTRHLSLARRHHLMATYESDLVEFNYVRNSLAYKKSTLFPRMIQWRLCTVVGSGKNIARKPILNGIVCTQHDNRVACCIFCEKKFKTTFHLLLHMNMFYPKLQFHAAYLNSQPGQVDYMSIDISTTPNYNEIDREIAKHDTTTTYFVRPRERKRKMRMVPMNPSLPLGSFSSRDFLSQIQGPEVLPEWPQSLRNNPFETTSRKRPLDPFATEDDDLPSFGLVRNPVRRNEDQQQE